MVYSNDIIVLITNDFAQNYSRNATAWGGNTNISGSTAGWANQALARDVTLKGYKSWLRVNQFANNTYFRVGINGTYDTDYDLYYGVSVTGVLEVEMDKALSAGQEVVIYHTEDAFSGGYEGYACLIGVYD